MKRFMKRLRNQQGATAVEYGIMVGLIAAIIIVVVIVVGNKTNNAFQAVNTNMSAAPFTS